MSVSDSLRRAVVGMAAALLIQSASGTVYYSGLKNIAIPTDFTGIYLNIDNGLTGVMEFTGWDINPFFGGFGIGNSASFQPVRTGSANESPIRALGFGAAVAATSLSFSSGQGGSSAHLGGGANQFGLGQEAYLGFRFSTDGNAGPFYGWMRVVLTANTSGGFIKDWAYESTGLGTLTGNVLQTAPVAGVAGTTLSGGSGQIATLGPLAGPSALAITKTGAGTWTLSQPQNYASLTASGGLTHVLTSLTNATVTANAASTIDFAVSQTLAALTIASGGTVILGPSAGSSPPEEFAAPFENAATGVPEPGCAALLASTYALMLACRRVR